MYINDHFCRCIQCMLFKPSCRIYTLTYVIFFILFTSDGVNMMHHVYTVLAFFDGFGFVEVEATGAR
jgi:hypothetical protein